jgi:drug/metabolite transporter (DMT)-like permease
MPSRKTYELDPLLRIILGVALVAASIVGLYHGDYTLFESGPVDSPRFGEGVGIPAVLGYLLAIVLGWGLFYYGMRDLPRRKD